jgi:hypothetical protein
MRSLWIDVDYYTAMCERVFSGLDMTGKPQALENTIDQGGYNIGGTNIFAANGSEDPW